MRDVSDESLRRHRKKFGASVGSARWLGGFRWVVCGRCAVAWFVYKRQQCLPLRLVTLMN